MKKIIVLATVIVFVGITSFVQGQVDETVVEEAVKTSIEAESFNEAFAKARALLGQGQSFVWNGNEYSTSYAEETQIEAATELEITDPQEIPPIIEETVIDTEKTEEAVEALEEVIEEPIDDIEKAVEDVEEEIEEAEEAIEDLKDVIDY